MSLVKNVNSIAEIGPYLTFDQLNQFQRKQLLRKERESEILGKISACESPEAMDNKRCVKKRLFSILPKNFILNSITRKLLSMIESSTFFKDTRNRWRKKCIEV